MDRRWMKLDASSRVLMITSAGCNALDYLLDDPKKVVCVDLNYRQNALLELKKTVLRPALFVSEFFDPGPQFDLPRPGRTILAMDVQVVLGDLVGQQHGVLAAFRCAGIARALKNAAVDHDMGNVNTLGLEFSGQALRHRA